jgi:hypothetical protein
MDVHARFTPSATTCGGKGGLMNVRRTFAVLALLALFVSISSAAVRTYQVTGPVLEVRSDMIAVQKGADRWEIARDGSTKGAAPKVGDKVTIEYRMTATAVEEKTPAPPKKKK